jgi:ABC-type polysaccharide/polyol phosphate transport system ATPase subunit
MSDVVIRAADVSKRFVIGRDNSLKERLINFRRARERRQEFWALRDVDLEIRSGHTIGLIGANGSGKSTLLKLIAGILTPTTGYVERRGRLAALLELGAGFHGDLTGRENIYLNASILGLTRKQVDKYFDAIVDFAAIEQFIDTQVKFYSSGMYVRLAFAVAVHVDPDILLIDEVLAVGDEPFQRKCLDRIRQFQHDGKTIVLVTHSLDQVRQMCDRVVLLEAGRSVVDGKPADAVRHFRETSSEAVSAERAQGRHLLSIENVRVTATDGKQQRVFGTNDPVVVEYDVVPFEPVDDWAAGIAIVDTAGTVVFGTNTTLRDLLLAPVERPSTVRFHFSGLPLAEGQYFVTVAVHPNVGADYDRVERAASFQVRTFARDAGLVALRPEIQVEDRPVGGFSVSRPAQLRDLT